MFCAASCHVPVTTHIAYCLWDMNTSRAVSPYSESHLNIPFIITTSTLKIFSFKYTNCLLTFLMLSVSIRFMECFVRLSIHLMFLFHAFTIIVWFITRLEAAAQACIICTVSYLWDCVQCNVVTKWEGRVWAYGCCCWFNHVLCILSSQGKRKVPSLTI